MILQVIDEYDEQSEVAERLRIKVRQASLQSWYLTTTITTREF